MEAQAYSLPQVINGNGPRFDFLGGSLINPDSLSFNWTYEVIEKC